MEPVPKSGGIKEEEEEEERPLVSFWAGEINPEKSGAQIEPPRKGGLLYREEQEAEEVMAAGVHLSQRAAREQGGGAQRVGSLMQE